MVPDGRARLAAVPHLLHKPELSRPTNLLSLNERFFPISIHLFGENGLRTPLVGSRLPSSAHLKYSTVLEERSGVTAMSGADGFRVVIVGGGVAGLTLANTLEVVKRSSQRRFKLR